MEVFLYVVVGSIIWSVLASWVIVKYETKWHADYTAWYTNATRFDRIGEDTPEGARVGRLIAILFGTGVVSMAWGIVLHQFWLFAVLAVVATVVWVVLNKPDAIVNLVQEKVNRVVSAVKEMEKK
jgi:uncharacterized protein YacL